MVRMEYLKEQKHTCEASSFPTSIMYNNILCKKILYYYLYVITNTVFLFYRDFFTFGNVSKENCSNLKGKFRTSAGNTWQPWTHEQRCRECSSCQQFEEIKS